MKIDRRSVMKRAWRDFKWWQRHGEPRAFSECLKSAWRVARVARDSGSLKFTRRAA